MKCHFKRVSFYLAVLLLFIFSTSSYGEEDDKKKPEKQPYDKGMLYFYLKTDYPETVTKEERDMLKEVKKLLIEKQEKIELLEKLEKIEIPENPEKLEKPENIENIEKPEKPENIEKPENPEKPENLKNLEKNKYNDYNAAAELKAESYKIIKKWYDDDVLKKLKKAVEDETLIQDAVKTYIRFLKRSDLLDVSDKFTEAKKASFLLIETMVGKGGDKIIAKAIETRDPSYLGWLLNYLVLLQQLEVEDAARFNKDVLLSKIVAASHFDIIIKNTVIIPMGRAPSDYYIAEGKGDLQLEKNLHFYGSGEVNVIKCAEEGEICIAVNGPEKHFFRITDLPSATTHVSGKKSSMIPFDYFASNKNSVTYKMADGSDTRFGNLGVWHFKSDHQDEIYDKLDEDYIEANKEHKNIVKIKDWEIVNNGKVYLRKVYKRTIPRSGHKEETVIELHYTPKTSK